MNNPNIKTNVTSNQKEKYHHSNDIVKTFLCEIGRIPLLTIEQEVFYAKQVQQMMVLLEAKEKLEFELKHEPTNLAWANRMQLSEETLLEQLSQGHIAKQAMIQANLRLVVSIAKKYLKRNVEFLDLIQEGTLGLERGVEKFDPTLGYKFSTYGYWWIRQAITRAISQQGRIIRLPVHITEKLNKIKRVQRELSQKLSRTPNVTEIAQALSLDPQQIRDCLLMARQPLSLDTRISSDKDTVLEDTLKDEKLDTKLDADQEFLCQDIDKLLLMLPPLQREILSLRFGLINEKELSLAQVSLRIGISRERVRQLEKQALSTLRRYRDKVHGHIAS
ncbi:RpoD family RNA polymerase sigma factor [Calothrix sp. NIES-4071]|nr:RpoD family RNA polymerase sigma factor [Calothrix sp. NIES-4071]BAZ55290.1 RpoD family RNA polymerase sigma factor [Calothrix sp. NIES-4105]